MEDFYERAFTRRYLPQWLVASGVALLIISGFVWWTQVYENPYNVWWGMLANNLSTSSVTSHLIEQTSDGTNLDQYIGQQFGVDTVAHGHTTLATSVSTLKTENIGTLSQDYVRYTSIATKQKGQDGKPLDFSNALDKWANQPAVNSASSTDSPPFFVQAVLGVSGGNVVPVANLTADKRQNLLNQLRRSVIFSIDYGKVKKETLNGRQVYTYSVDIEPVAYIAYEKAFAADLGIKALDTADPNSYQGEQAITVSVSVDIRSHQLAEVSYPGAKHQTFYSSYGVPINAKLPKATLSSTALQAMVSKTQ